ncbi:uncharacterized protein LOC132872678 [Neoarius graeffei]|uniref:uncharacterized protein LOC132872678 n=1 Tax=Neoarius graeffei TaxID=443677 RepID=UPI00298C88CF|nr:uncharacterized protein LOC132872678 [Neoarius graeffei]
MVLRQLDCLIQRRRAVAPDPLRSSCWQASDELFQHHLVEDSFGVVVVGPQPPPAGVPELLAKRERSADFLQAQRAEALALLFRSAPHVLEDGPAEVRVGQLAVGGELEHGQLCFSREQGEEARCALLHRPPRGFGDLLKERDERLGVILRAHLGDGEGRRARGRSAGGPRRREEVPECLSIFLLGQHQGLEPLFLLLSEGE